MTASPSRTPAPQYKPEPGAAAALLRPQPIRVEISEPAADDYFGAIEIRVGDDERTHLCGGTGRGAVQWYRVDVARSGDGPITLTRSQLQALVAAAHSLLDDATDTLIAGEDLDAGNFVTVDADGTVRKFAAPEDEPTAQRVRPSAAELLDATRDPSFGPLHGVSAASSHCVLDFLHRTGCDGYPHGIRDDFLGALYEQPLDAPRYLPTGVHLSDNRFVFADTMATRWELA